MTKNDEELGNEADCCTPPDENNPKVFALATSSKVVPAPQFVDTTKEVSVKAAVVPAEVGGYTFACGPKSGADSNGIYATIFIF